MSNPSATFSGFPRETFDFLAGLSRNNAKSWFDAHRDVYDAAVVSPALQFVETMGAVLQVLAPSLQPEPRVGGSLFRIQRDLRFCADKSPYKTHVGIRFRDRDTIVSSKCTGPLFYVEFDARSLRLGVGIKEFDPRTLASYREQVSGDRGDRHIGEILNGMVTLAGKNGHEILGSLLTRPPQNYLNTADRELLRRKGLFIRGETELPEEIHSSEFIAYCETWFRPYLPLFHGLRAIALAGLDSNGRDLLTDTA